MRATGCCQSAKLHIFHTLDHSIPVDFDMQLAKTQTYTVICRISLFVAPCHHNPPMLQTDRQTGRGK